MGEKVTCGPFVESSVAVGVALVLEVGLILGLGKLVAKPNPKGARSIKIKRKFLFTDTST